jgi:hypothetical protein
VGAMITRIDIRIGHFSKESIAGAIISFVAVQTFHPKIDGSSPSSTITAQSDFFYTPV